MKGHEFNKLMKRYKNLYDESEYLCHVAHMSKDEREKEEAEEELDMVDTQLMYLADNIKKAEGEISRYMRKKYEFELEDIRNEYY